MKTKVIVIVSGGVATIYTNNPDIMTAIIDFDNYEAGIYPDETDEIERFNLLDTSVEVLEHIDDKVCWYSVSDLATKMDNDIEAKITMDLKECGFFND